MSPTLPIVQCDIQVLSKNINNLASKPEAAAITLSRRVSHELTLLRSCYVRLLIRALRYKAVTSFLSLPRLALHLHDVNV